MTRFSNCLCPMSTVSTQHTTCHSSPSQAWKIFFCILVSLPLWPPLWPPLWHPLWPQLWPPLWPPWWPPLWPTWWPPLWPPWWPPLWPPLWQLLNILTCDLVCQTDYFNHGQGHISQLFRQRMSSFLNIHITEPYSSIVVVAKSLFKEGSPVSNAERQILLSIGGLHKMQND